VYLFIHNILFLPMKIIGLIIKIIKILLYQEKNTSSILRNIFIESSHKLWTELVLHFKKTWEYSDKKKITSFFLENKI
jgi:hypothetical protein